MTALMTPGTRLTLAAALTTALASSALAPMYRGLGWVLPVLGAVLVVALAGAAARSARLPAFAVPLVQLPAAFAYAALLYLPGSLGSPSAALLGAELLLLDARVGVEELAPPVPTRPELVLLAVLGAAAVAAAVDLLAVGLRRAALAGLPLLVLLAVPSGLVPGGLGWLPFTLGGAGWLLLLRVEAEQRVERWGTALPAATGEQQDGASGRVGRRIGAAALGVAAIVPALVPGLDARLLPGSDGLGADGERTTVTYNPITRLQGQLTRPDPQEVLRYRSTDEAPDYLRLTTLDVFDGAGWRSSSLRGEDVDDGIALSAGSLADLRDVEVRASLSDFLDSQWLPLPAAPREVDVDGRWLWDGLSETVFSTTSNTNRIDEYTAQVRRLVPDREALEAATVDGVPDPRYGEPVAVAEQVRALTQEVVAGADNPYDRAVALQDFFRSGLFDYDETTGPVQGDPLGSFLLRSRRGFCEQFASAMAAMMRVAGIPSRVAVGFTPGRLSGEERVVTTDDAHAWPEGWFDGLGWVRFEPTPSGDGRTAVPEYTEEEVQAPDAGGPAPSASAAPAPAPTSTAGALPNEFAGDGRQTPSTASDRLEPTAWEAARGALLAAAVLGLLATPAVLAALRRRSRWRRPSALAAWDQLREDAEDLGLPWSDADSPRGAVARLAQDRALPSLAVDALGRLARATERARYSRDGALGELTVDGLRADVALVRSALDERSTRGRRLRARLAPPSALRWLSSRAGRLTADVLDRVDDVLGALPRRLRRRSA